MQVVGLAIGSSSDLLKDMEAFTAGHFRTANSFEGLKDVLTMFTQFLCSGKPDLSLSCRSGTKERFESLYHYVQADSGHLYLKLR